MSCLLLRMPWRALAKLSLQLSALLIQDRMVEKKKDSLAHKDEASLRGDKHNDHTQKSFRGKRSLQRHPKLSGYVTDAKNQIVCSIGNIPSLFL